MLSGLVLAGAVTGAAFQGTAHAAAPAAPHALVKVITESRFGHLLVTTRGYALYYFSQEKHGAIKCTGACAKVWPPLLVMKGDAVPMHLNSVMGTFGVVTRPDKTRQLTFDHKPLYRYTGDTRPGQVLCDGVGGWYAVRVMGH